MKVKVLSIYDEPYKGSYRVPPAEQVESTLQEWLRDNPKAPIRHIEVLHGFPPGGGVWGVRDIENAVRIKVVYDDPPDGIRCRE